MQGIQQTEPATVEHNIIPPPQLPVRSKRLNRQDTPPALNTEKRHRHTAPEAICLSSAGPANHLSPGTRAFQVIEEACVNLETLPLDMAQLRDETHDARNRAMMLRREARELEQLEQDKMARLKELQRTQRMWQHFNRASTF